MKTLAIATIVGAIILYIYLAIVHTVLSPLIHESDFKYTSDQDNILNSLSSLNLEDGVYHLPYPPPGTPMSEHGKMMMDRMGKPWAILMYHNEMTYGISAYIMSLIYNIIAVLIICIALAAASNRLTSFGQRLWFVMLFPLFILFASIMMGYNWDGFPMHFIRGQIIDIFAGYFLVGLW